MAVLARIALFGCALLAWPLAGAAGFLEKEVVFSEAEIQASLAKAKPQQISYGGLITVAAAREGSNGDWRVEVSDTGSGIPAAVLPQVFKPMFTTKPEGKGTGLGLPICREIVRGHGGEIALRSEEGRGTTVSFTLPKPA